jgi:hypothetical protein
VEIDQNQLELLVTNPSESRNVEIKRWIDPASPDGQAKIIRATFALRNLNGGFFVIGFENDGAPSVDPPNDVHTVFHVDIIQGLISRYASELFEIGVAFAVFEGVEYPVICVPTGVQTPVALKRPLVAAGATLIEIGVIFFRTLAANGTPSTSQAMPEDWREIIEICFDNREADIGRFLRRQLTGKDLPLLTSVLRDLLTPNEPVQAVGPTLESRARGMLDDE